jgi:hypothetical protein
MRRRHRWIRGDWQIASWLFRRVPGSAGHIEPNVLSPLSQWKILDNLRRSLVPVSLLLLMLGNWLLVPELGGLGSRARRTADAVTTLRQKANQFSLARVSPPDEDCPEG